MQYYVVVLKSMYSSYDDNIDTTGAVVILLPRVVCEVCIAADLYTLCLV